MSRIKVASWNIYLWWKMVRRRQGKLEINPKDSRRESSVGGILQTLDEEVLGIVECMSKPAL